MMSWSKYAGINRFQPDEFLEDPERYADIFFLRQLDAFAIALDKAVYPSPVSGALARFKGSKTSRHYAIGRLSDACDIFCNCQISKAWTMALQFFTGVGVYFDTHYKGVSWPMLHVDSRPKTLIWYRDENSYHYPGEKNFYLTLFEKLVTTVIGGEK